ncbi:hypothetical protein Val02_51660 [Virgisporangium aliadipatigenens]|uniref:Uncharacterized protein n=1 Tax=Virgisporangium aliadipatigenens TaxID=741659 RepID=A0A8J4DRM1_9ACTN|nr:hypothetical protein [Virgisporangium aliadipatigenens]GIJ48280.1 hypothetical protein Val02_51660 [Virgisporangium aliadipatigenens]
MAYPGDPAQQQPQQYYQDGAGYPAQPAPGYHDPNFPASGPPVSGTPYSGVPYSGPPMAVQPISGPVTGPGPGPATPGGGRNQSTVVFASLTVLLLLVTAVLGVLYGTKSGDYNDEKRTVAARDADLAGTRSDLEKTKADLEKTKKDLDAANAALKDSQTDADELKRQKQVIANCINLLIEAGRAQSAGDTATAAAKDAEADKVCDEAFRHLGIR